MKTSFVSTNTISQSMRYQMLRMQSELTQKQQEATTGTVADPGVSLGAGVGRTVSLNRDITRLNGLVDSNSLASNRLSVTQSALGQVSEAGQSLLSALTAATTGAGNASLTQSAAKGALDTITNLLNTNLNGEYLFAGINTDVKPINDFSDPSSASRTAFDTAFTSHFGFSQSDPAASGITADEMTNFLDTVVEPQFLGAGWSNLSNATDQQIVSRISLSETTETSVTANTDGSRKLMMAAASVSALLDAPLGQGARNALYQKALALVGEGISDTGNTQAVAGLAENRISDASDRISSQIDLSNKFLNDLEGVDPYEAATRVNNLLTQIETSYSLTARISQLNLIQYLP